MPRLNVKPLQKRAPSTQARYERRFVNGVWTIFDRWNFDHGPAIHTAREAARTADALNMGSLKWTA